VVAVASGVLLLALVLSKFLNGHSHGGPCVGWLVCTALLFLGLTFLLAWTKWKAPSVRCLILPEPAAAVRTLIVLATGDEAGSFLNSTSLLMLSVGFIARWPTLLVLPLAAYLPAL